MKRFLFSLLLSIPILCAAQSNYQKGYVVTNSSDTLSGYIDYKEREHNASSFYFKKELNSEPQKFTLADCMAYGIYDMDYFERFEVDISMSKTKLSDLPDERDLTTRRDSVFLRVLQTGKYYTLYLYHDDLKERFYLREKGSLVAKELVRNLYMHPNSSSSTLVTEDKYVSQLLMASRTVNGVNETEEARLKNIRYTAKDLIMFFAKLNGEELTKPKFSTIRYFAGGGLNISTGKYSGENRFTNENAKNKTSYLPYLTAGVDIFSNPAIRKLVFRAELSLWMSKSEISTTTPVASSSILKHSFDEYTASLTPQVIYHLYNADDFKVFFGIGAGLSFSNYKNNLYSVTNTVFTPARETVEEDRIELKSFSLSFPVSAGVVLNKKVEISAAYAARSAISQYVDYSVNLERIRIGVKYLFGKH